MHSKSCASSWKSTFHLLNCTTPLPRLISHNPLHKHALDECHTVDKQISPYILRTTNPTLFHTSLRPSPIMQPINSPTFSRLPHTHPDPRFLMQATFYVWNPTTPPGTKYSVNSISSIAVALRVHCKILFLTQPRLSMGFN